MKFKDYLEELNAFAEEFPDTLEYDVVYASDDDGREYNIVNNGPCTGYFEGSDLYFDDELPNAVCVN